MLIKNNGARGWHVGGKLIAPGQSLDVAVTEADVKDNKELEVVKVKAEKPAKAEKVVEVKPEAESKAE
jgi:hypothetical protein